MLNLNLSVFDWFYYLKTESWIEGNKSDICIYVQIGSLTCAEQVDKRMHDKVIAAAQTERIAQLMN